MATDKVGTGPGGTRRVALITGGAKGFGQAIALRMAEDGHDVGVLDIGPAEEAGAAVRARGSRFLSLICDVSDYEAVKAATAKMEEGLGPVDILIANAGIYPIASFADTDAALWRRVMSINLDGTYNLFSAFLPGMKERGWGRVVAMISGTVFAPPPNFSAYAASKAGVVGLVRAVAREYGGFGVTVNAVAPPLVETPGVAAGPQRSIGVFDLVMSAQAVKREGVAEDIVGPISFLVSADSHFITGQSIVADGGTHFL